MIYTSIRKYGDWPVNRNTPKKVQEEIWRLGGDLHLLSAEKITVVDGFAGGLPPLGDREIRVIWGIPGVFGRSRKVQFGNQVRLSILMNKEIELKWRASCVRARRN